MADTLAQAKANTIDKTLVHVKAEALIEELAVTLDDVQAKALVDMLNDN